MTSCNHLCVDSFERPVKQHLVVCYSFMHSDVSDTYRLTVYQSTPCQSQHRLQSLPAGQHSALANSEEDARLRCSTLRGLLGGF